VSEQNSKSTPPLPRKKPSVWWYLSGFIALFLAWFFYQLFGPSPAIIVSKETTYITTPLRPDGLPDYEKYVLDLMREGVTSENNAAVSLVEAMGLTDLSAEELALVCQEIGVPQAATKALSLTSLYGSENRGRIAQWMHQKTRDDDAVTNGGTTGSENSAIDSDSLATGRSNEDRAIYGIIEQAESRSWTTKDLPPLATWLVSNSDSLDLLVQACDRPKYYLPPPEMLDNQSESIAVALVSVQLARDVARSLSARTMWHLGENRPAEAWLNLRAIHRMSRLLAQQPTLVGRLIAIAISGIADKLTITLVTHGNPTPELLTAIKQELESLSHGALIRDSLEAERIFMLNSVMLARSAGPSQLLRFTLSDTTNPAIDALDIISFDSNIVLRSCNRWVDRAETAAKLTTRGERITAYSQIVRDLETAAEYASRRSLWITGALNRSGRSSLLAANIAHLMLGSVLASQPAEDRAIRSRSMVRAAVEVSLVRATHGEYPASLANLASDAAELVPVDENGRPFLYKRLEEGFLLYSVGENGSDDGGSNESAGVLEGHSRDLMNQEAAEALLSKIPPGADDHSIRIPGPKFKLP